MDAAARPVLPISLKALAEFLKRWPFPEIGQSAG